MQSACEYEKAHLLKLIALLIQELFYESTIYTYMSYYCEYVFIITWYPDYIDILKKKKNCRYKCQIFFYKL